MSFVEDVKLSATNLFNGKCFQNFDKMPSKRQVDVAVKVALVALAVGLLLGFLAGPIVGSVVAAVVAVVV